VVVDSRCPRGDTTVAMLGLTEGFMVGPQTAFERADFFMAVIVAEEFQGPVSPTAQRAPGDLLGGRHRRGHR
jgi:hypothetical protein